MIQDLMVRDLKKIVDERGMVMHMLRSDSPMFNGFGEIYFSVVNPNIIKAWKKHNEMTQHFAVPVGSIRLVIYDDRKNSGTCGNIEELEIGEDNYSLIKIPPGVWYGFKGVSPVPALIANCTDLPHDPRESEHISINSGIIPYVWK
ncbi:MAG: dTDP-4-dehydrorhamnose 3,5-epimerase [Peptococcaceae bacterium BRH_c4a]|nr:MAG: dTDP-4-dehydrorhamnose 3,5-epimerase [Peptococcaceae bacterium BRH_c4a]